MQEEHKLRGTASWRGSLGAERAGAPYQEPTKARIHLQTNKFLSTVSLGSVAFLHAKSLGSGSTFTTTVLGFFRSLSLLMLSSAADVFSEKAINLHSWLRADELAASTGVTEGLRSFMSPQGCVVQMK